MKSLLSWLRREYTDTKILMRSIPATVVTLFVVSVICMNLLANKTLLQLPWIALDGGILISWLSFMCMDIITKHFGPGASNRVSVLACGINLLTCAIFFIAAAIAYLYETRRLRDGALRCRAPRLAKVGLITIALLFAVFTFLPPELEIFRDPQTGGLGI
jgi:uncharacterized PurR-regulated membrane protein YhhQ (DUF165 family)